MKTIVIIFCFFALLSCKKDKVRNPFENKLIVLQVGNDFEGGVEFDLNQSNNNIDDFDLYYTSISNGLQSTSYFQSSLINDTIFSLGPSNVFKYFTDFNPAENYTFLNENLTHENENFVQLISSKEIQYQEIWSKVANLDIVKQFKHFNPNEKIGISKLVVSEYDELIGFNVPKVKYFIFLVN